MHKRVELKATSGAAYRMASQQALHGRDAWGKPYKGCGWIRGPPNLGHKQAKVWSRVAAGFDFGSHKKNRPKIGLKWASIQVHLGLQKKLKKWVLGIEPDKNWERQAK